MTGVATDFQHHHIKVTVRVTLLQQRVVVKIRSQENRCPKTGRGGGLVNNVPRDKCDTVGKLGPVPDVRISVAAEVPKDQWRLVWTLVAPFICNIITFSHYILLWQCLAEIHYRRTGVGIL
jgi:hypothetical protein